MNKYIVQAMVRKAYYKATGKHLKSEKKPTTSWLNDLHLSEGANLDDRQI